ncbi:hypothetical protein PBY51_022332 [Eleginops maclovinus]|uniref:Uncharacterized protein n=1 Tax=Eleginops maclovinus TaxID=56733 RepID=A0AAN7XHK5_ELEMC|nr:hypothetical protein PBY51_022332 [Eleginops maclovinus]
MGGSEEGVVLCAEASGTHAPLADPLSRRSAGNLRNEIGASPVSAISARETASHSRLHTAVFRPRFR